MSIDRQEIRLSKITTNWEGLAFANGIGDPNAEARNEILMRYASCVYKYILGATNNPHVAEDLAQEFALRFVRGDYSNVDPAKGRFRDYLKTSLRNLVTDHFREKQSYELTSSKADRLADSVSTNQLAMLEEEFQTHWRQQTLANAWESLREFQQTRDNFYYTVLHMRAKSPKLGSDEIAKIISSDLNQKVTAEWVRQKLHRARHKFAELLVVEIRQSLSSNDEESIQDELTYLGLQKYICKGS